MVEANVRTALVKMEFPSWEYDHIKVCSTIRYLKAINESPKEIVDEINRVYGEWCMNIQNIICKQRREYLAGQSHLYNKPSNTSYLKTCDLLEEHLRTLILEVCYHLQSPDCGRTSVWHIVKNVLRLRKLPSRCIPHRLTTNHKKKIV